jgi:hypothetical protein
LCNIFKIKSCNMSIHLPFLQCASNIVANHSSGLWSVRKMKWFLCKCYLKCMMPHIGAYHSPSMGWNFFCAYVKLLLAQATTFQACLPSVIILFQHLLVTNPHQDKIISWN